MAEPFTLQLHITDRCQLQCRHCYRDTMHADLPMGQLQAMVEKFIAFCELRGLAGRLTLAGGEPLIRYGELLVLGRQAQTAGVQVHVLTNGLLLTELRIAEMRSAGVMRTQISVDGDEAVHDSLRGQGCYQKTLLALELLRVNGMWSTISMTLGRWNVQRLEHVIGLAKQYGAKLFVSRHVPCGAGMSLQAETLAPDEWKRAMHACASLSHKHRAGVAMRDPLFGPLNEESPADALAVGGCSIGYGGLAVDSDGTAYPCRRLPIPVGNLLVDSFEQIWNHPLLGQLRDRDRLKGRCGECRWRWRCGGCRAIAHGFASDALAEDPQCPYGRLARVGVRQLAREGVAWVAF